MTLEQAKQCIAMKKASKHVDPKLLAEAEKVIAEAEKKAAAEAEKKAAAAEKGKKGNKASVPTEKAEEEGKPAGNGGGNGGQGVSRRETFAVVPPWKGDFVVQCAA